MATQPLIPFKAKFIITVDTKVRDFLKVSEENSLEDKFKRIADELGNVDIPKLINFYHLGSNIYDKYKHIHPKYNQVFDVNPANMLLDDGDFNLYFKLHSADIEVLQIIDEKVTFANSSNEVHTIELNDNLKLIKI